MGGKCARNVFGPCTAAVSFNSTGRERDGRAVSPSVKPIFMRFPVLSKTKINFETEKFDVNMTQVWKKKKWMKKNRKWKSVVAVFPSPGACAWLEVSPSSCRWRSSWSTWSSSRTSGDMFFRTSMRSCPAAGPTSTVSSTRSSSIPCWQICFSSWCKDNNY